MSLQGFQLQISYKNPCRIASTGNLGLTGLAAIDGVTPVAGDRILVKNQSSAAQNGIYHAAAGAWTRALDYSSGIPTAVTAGLSVYIQEGTLGGTTWTLVTTGAIVIGTTATVWDNLASSHEPNEPVTYTWRHPDIMSPNTVEGRAYADFAALYAHIVANYPPYVQKIILVDGLDGAIFQPMVMPAGTFDLGTNNIEMRGVTPRRGVGATREDNGLAVRIDIDGSVTTLSVPDTTYAGGCLRFSHLQFYVSGGPPITFSANAGYEPIIFLRDVSVIHGGAPFILLTNDANPTLRLEDNTLLYGDGAAVVEQEDTSELTLVLRGGSFVYADSLAGEATCTIFLNRGVEDSFGTQPSFLGDLEEIGLAVVEGSGSVFDAEARKLPRGLDVVHGLSGVKQPCRTASEPGQNINPAGGVPAAIDGVTLATGDRVLLWQQTDAEENGIYRCTDPGASGTLVRDYDMDRSAYVQEGMLVPIGPSALVTGRQMFYLDTAGPFVLGTTELNYVSGRSFVRSDPTQVSVGSAVAFTASQATATATAWIPVNDFDDIDVYVEVTNDNTGTITECTVFMESTGTSSTPAGTDGAVLQSDDGISLGAVSLGDYLPSKLFPGAPTFELHWNFPSRGAQVRFKVFANVTGGAYNIFYKRNVRA